MSFTHEFKPRDKATVARPRPETTLTAGTQVTVTRLGVGADGAAHGAPYLVEIQAANGDLAGVWADELDPQ